MEQKVSLTQSINNIKLIFSKTCMLKFLSLKLLGNLSLNKSKILHQNTLFMTKKLIKKSSIKISTLSFFTQQNLFVEIAL